MYIQSIAVLFQNLKTATSNVGKDRNKRKEERKKIDIICYINIK